MSLSCTIALKKTLMPQKIPASRLLLGIFWPPEIGFDLFWTLEVAHEYIHTTIVPTMMETHLPVNMSLGAQELLYRSQPVQYLEGFTATGFLVYASH